MLRKGGYGVEPGLLLGIAAPPTPSLRGLAASDVGRRLRFSERILVRLSVLFGEVSEDRVLRCSGGVPNVYFLVLLDDLVRSSAV